MTKNIYTVVLFDDGARMVWFLNGKFYSSHCSLRTYVNDRKDWHVEGKEYTEEEYKEAVRETPCSLKNIVETDRIMTKLNTGGIAADQLRSFVERVERTEEEIKASNEDKKEIYAELKASGFDPKIIRKIIALRKMDQADRQKQEALIDVYLHAIEGGERISPTAEVVAINE